MKPEHVYQTVKELSEPFIQNYHDDLLVHDKNSIEGNIENFPFLHFTGTLGTYIFIFESSEKYPAKGEIVKYLFGHAGREHILEKIFESVKWCRTSNRQALILYYDGTRISKINQDIAESLAEDYIETMKRKWREE
jgi:hypothetical protein